MLKNGKRDFNESVGDEPFPVGQDIGHLFVVDAKPRRHGMPHTLEERAFMHRENTKE